MLIGNINCYGIIYKITNKINGKIYIGQTTKSRGFKGRYDYSGNGIERVYKVMEANRFTRHYNDHLFKSIEKYGLDSFEVIEIFDIAFSKNELDYKEKSWISIYKSTDRKFGYNFTDGGSNGKPNEEVNFRNSLSKLGKNLRSKNPNSKKVICLTLNKEFNCILDASDQLNINRTMICDACSGRRKSAGKINDKKLVWMFYDDYLNDKVEVKKRLSEDYVKAKSKCKKVICITTNKKFESVKDAANFYNLKSKGNIVSCCQGKLNYCGTLSDGTKLIWKYCE